MKLAERIRVFLKDYPQLFIRIIDPITEDLRYPAEEIVHRARTELVGTERALVLAAMDIWGGHGEVTLATMLEDIPRSAFKQLLKAVS